MSAGYHAERKEAMNRQVNKILFGPAFLSDGKHGTRGRGRPGIRACEGILNFTATPGSLYSSADGPARRKKAPLGPMKDIVHANSSLSEKQSSNCTSSLPFEFHL